MIIKGVGNKPVLSELQALQSQVQDSPIDSDLIDQLDEVVAKAEDWLEKLRKAVAKKGANVKVRGLVVREWWSAN